LIEEGVGVILGVKYTGEFTRVIIRLSAAQCCHDEYTGPWSGNRDIEVSGNDGLYIVKVHGSLP
jgi:hypothetical protein